MQLTEADLFRFLKDALTKAQTEGLIAMRTHDSAESLAERLAKSASSNARELKEIILHHFNHLFHEEETVEPRFGDEQAGAESNDPIGQPAQNVGGVPQTERPVGPPQQIGNTETPQIGTHEPAKGPSVMEPGTPYVPQPGYQPTSPNNQF